VAQAYRKGPAALPVLPVLRKDVDALELPTNYQRGRRGEYEVKEVLQRQGFFVIRSAGSHSPVDLLSGNGRVLWAIQVKKGPKSLLDKKGAEELIVAAAKLRAFPVLAYYDHGWQFETLPTLAA